MSLQPLFSLTPSKAFSNTYDPSDPQAPYASAGLLTFGGVSGWFWPYRLSDQLNDDSITLGFRPVPLADQQISSITDDVYAKSAVEILFTGFNVKTQHQYLVVMQFGSDLTYGIGGNISPPTAQIFVYSTLVRTEQMDGDETVAILADCPGDRVPLSVFVRLASAQAHARMHFKGVTAYLL